MVSFTIVFFFINVGEVNDMNISCCVAVEVLVVAAAAASDVLVDCSPVSSCCWGWCSCFDDDGIVRDDGGGGGGGVDNSRCNVGGVDDVVVADEMSGLPLIPSCMMLLLLFGTTNVAVILSCEYSSRDWEKNFLFVSLTWNDRDGCSLL
jgi:hypothetical protein